MAEQNEADPEALRRINAAAVAWAADEVKRHAACVSCGAMSAFTNEAKLRQAIAVLRLALDRYEADR